MGTASKNERNKTTVTVVIDLTWLYIYTCLKRIPRRKEEKDFGSCIQQYHVRMEAEDDNNKLFVIIVNDKIPKRDAWEQFEFREQHKNLKPYILVSLYSAGSRWE